MRPLPPWLSHPIQQCLTGEGMGGASGLRLPQPWAARYPGPVAASTPRPGHTKATHPGSQATSRLGQSPIGVTQELLRGYYPDVTQELPRSHPEATCRSASVTKLSSTTRCARSSREPPSASEGTKAASRVRFRVTCGVVVGEEALGRACVQGEVQGDLGCGGGRGGTWQGMRPG